MTPMVPSSPTTDLRQLIRLAIRVTAWLLVSGLVVLTVVPPVMRPVSPAPSEFEHFVSFMLAGALQYLSYLGRLFPWLLIAVLFAGATELLQIPMSGRHARVTDFLIDALAGCSGILIGFVVSRSRIAPYRSRF
jgi:VanZ family protein